MSTGKEQITFIAPSLHEENYSTAYILGNIVWLFMQSEQHKNMPLHMMNSQIFPAIVNKQYVLAMSANGSPLFYMAWANFNAETEAAYMRDYNMALSSDNWNNGDRSWVLFVVAPTGEGLSASSKWCQENILADAPEVRFFYHRGKTKGRRVLCKRGKNVSAADSLKWHLANQPLENAPMQLEKDVIALNK